MCVCVCMGLIDDMIKHVSTAGLKAPDQAPGALRPARRAPNNN